MNNQRIYQLIGLCQKARKIVTGEFAVKQAVLAKEVKLVIVTEDASNNTKKLFHDKCSYRNIPQVEWGNRADMGQILGKEQRVVVGITEPKLAKKILDMIGSEE